MKKQIFGRQLKRDTNERKALFKGLVSSLTMYERIETTEEKAKAIRSHVEKLVTKAKTNDTNHARTLLQAYLTNEALQKMLTDIAPRNASRPGGYTRILKIGNRFSDNASMVIMEWVEKGSTTSSAAPRNAKSAKQKAIDEVASTTAVEAKPAKAKKAPAKKAAVKTTKKKEASK